MASAGKKVFNRLYLLHFSRAWPSLKRVRYPASHEDCEHVFITAELCTNFSSRTIIMLLKFNSPDLLNTELVDTTCGRPRYTILSRASYIIGKDNDVVGVASRYTSIVDAYGKAVATIGWTGRQKKSGGVIRIMDQDPVKLFDLFGGCDTICAA